MGPGGLHSFSSIMLDTGGQCIDKAHFKIWKYKNDPQQVLVGGQGRPRWVEGPGRLPGRGGLCAEPGIRVSLGRAWRRRETAVGGTGQARVPGGVGLEVLKREEPGLAG